MFRRRTSSIWKLAGMMLGVIAAAMGLMWLLTSWALQRSFDEVGRAIILDDLGEYGGLYEKGGAAGVAALFTAGTHEHDQMLRILAPDGKVALEVLAPDEPEVTWPDLSQLSPPPIGETQWHRTRFEHGLVLTIGRQSMKDGGELWFGRTNTLDRQAIDRVHNLSLIAFCVTALIAIGPVFWFANRVLRPVSSLIKGAHILANDSNFGHRLESAASIPELRDFSEAFNLTLDRIQVLTEELEAANDQLAHELRTPLARVRGNIERIVTRSENPENREDAARSLEEIDRATHLIHDILSIRAGDSRTMKLQLETLSLSDLVREICELYSAAAEEKNLLFEFLITGEEAMVTLDRQRFQQALCNLLDNALSYTPAGGEVEVEVIFEENSVVVAVRDTGPGLTEEDVERIWRRFSRGSAASASTPGIGLGL
ncbi:MAG: HAMP domain-containing histidine kinase, partial [Verrucomicrobiae bacterium]|nr:HAMP domain-containing histidine kinase [Verrucomicrobiae bacterium]